MVKVEVPEPFTDGGLKEQAGGAVVATAPFSVILLQEKVTVAVNFCAAVTVTVDVADPPAATLPGEGGEADDWKSIPTPDRGTVCGLPSALSVTLKVPVRVPVVVGVNVTRI